MGCWNVVYLGVSFCGKVIGMILKSKIGCIINYL